MKVFTEVFNPFSSKYHAIQNYSKLSIRNKIITAVATTILGVITLGLLIAPTFRLLVGRFSKTPPKIALKVQKVALPKTPHQKLIQKEKNPEKKTNPIPLPKEPLPTPTKKVLTVATLKPKVIPSTPHPLPKKESVVIHKELNPLDGKARCRFTNTLNLATALKNRQPGKIWTKLNYPNGPDILDAIPGRVQPIIGVNRSLPIEFGGIAREGLGGNLEERVFSGNLSTNINEKKENITFFAIARRGKISRKEQFMVYEEEVKRKAILQKNKLDDLESKITIKMYELIATSKNGFSDSMIEAFFQNTFSALDGKETLILSFIIGGNIYTANNGSARAILVGEKSGCRQLSIANSKTTHIPTITKYHTTPGTSLILAGRGHYGKPTQDVNFIDVSSNEYAEIERECKMRQKYTPLQTAAFFSSIPHNCTLDSCSTIIARFES